MIWSLSFGASQDTLISGLLERNLNDAFSHIRGLKDVVDCRWPLFVQGEVPCSLSKWGSQTW